MESDFRTVYPHISEVIELIMEADKKESIRFHNTAELKEGAQAALDILDEWVQPKLPFGHVTDEDIAKAEESRRKHYGRPLIISDEYGSDEDCKTRVNGDPDYFLGMTEDEVRRIAYMAFDEDLDIIMNELANAHKGPVVVTGSVGRWNGRVPVSRKLDSIRDIRQLNNADGIALFVKDGDLRMEVYHHDGTNKYIIHKIRGGELAEIDESELITDEGSVSYTGSLCLESLVSDLAAYFGWEDDQKGDNAL